MTLEDHSDQLYTKNHVIASPMIYQGSANSAVIRVGELFREAVKHNSVAMIVVHNHPSGDPTPSPEDVAVTREIVRAGALLEIEVQRLWASSAGNSITADLSPAQ